MLNTINKKHIINDNDELVKISKMLHYYVQTNEYEFNKVNEKTIQNGVEYGFNLFISHEAKLTSDTFLDTITQTTILSSKVYTSEDASHIVPRFDEYISDDQDFILGTPAISCFVGFVHSHPSVENENICFSPPDIVSLIRMAKLWGNQYTNEKEKGKYFTLLLECPSCRYALVITDINKAKDAYQKVVDDYRVKNPNFTGSNNAIFTDMVSLWYYTKDTPLYDTGISKEQQHEKTVKHVLQKLGNDCGIVLFKSISDDKTTFTPVL